MTSITCTECPATTELTSCHDCDARICADCATWSEECDFAFCPSCASTRFDEQDAAEEAQRQIEAAAAKQAAEDAPVNARLATFLGYRQNGLAWERGERDEAGYSRYSHDMPHTTDLNTVALAEAEILKRQWGEAYVATLHEVVDPESMQSLDDTLAVLVTAPARARARALVQVLDQLGA